MSSSDFGGMPRWSSTSRIASDAKKTLLRARDLYTIIKSRRELTLLTARHFDVLHAIVQNYIETGEPVASRTVARKYPMSSASIRNMMADLLQEGYLSQPHTSAGRIPTLRAYQSYVKTLFASRIIRAELDRLHLEIEKAGSVEARIERSSKLLTEITRNFGIAAAIPTTRAKEDRDPFGIHRFMIV